MSSTEIFATTPRRIFNSKTQSVDRNGFGSGFGSIEPKSEITFESLKGMAPSTLRAGSHTPSRMVKGRKTLPNSEQPSRLGRPSLSINGRDVNANLLEKFKSQNEIKSCLKTKIKSSEKPIKGGNETDTDLTTSLNTMRNAENAKSVKAFLEGTEEEEVLQPRKKRRAVTFTSELHKIEESPGKEDIHKMLSMILQNQKVIMDKLEDLESHLS